MSLSQKHRSARREKVLLAARRCFIRHGFHATGMAEIGKACRMSVGNIYHYFINKEAIVRAITDETRSRIVPVLRHLEQHPDPVEAIIQTVLLAVKEGCRGSDARLWIEMAAEAPRNKAIRGIYLALDRDIRTVLTTLMRRAVEAGNLAPSLDLETTALWLVALMDGAISRMSLDPATDLTRALDALAWTLRRCLNVESCRAISQ